MNGLPLTYDPRKVTTTLGGETVYGYSEGSLISISKADQVTTTTRGVDGKDLTININPMSDGTATLTLQHTSPFNKYLYTWAEAYKLGRTELYFVPFEMNDPSGAYIATYAWLESVPDYALGQETGELSWVIHLQDATPKPNQSYARASGLASLIGANLF